jgi:uronate dehydrogenase
MSSIGARSMKVPSSRRRMFTSSRKIVYGVSGNTRSWYDNSNATRLGYRPQDNAESFSKEVLAREKPGDPQVEMYQGGLFVAIEEVANPAAERQGAKK